MPVGTLKSEKDRSSWTLIKKIARVDIVKEFGPRTFVGVSAKTAVIRVQHGGRKDYEVHTKRELPAKEFHRSVRITRGNVCMHEIKAFLATGGVPLVHTTALRSNGLYSVGPGVNGAARRIEGPAVLIPRVGAPSLDKLAFLPEGRTVAPSDCVIAIHGDPKCVLHTWETLMGKWPAFAELYGGSCAPYITINRIVSWLARNGVGAEYYVPSTSR